MGVEYFNGICFVHRISQHIPANQCYVRFKDNKYYIHSREKMPTVDCIAAINNYLKEKDDKDSKR